MIAPPKKKRRKDFEFQTGYVWGYRRTAKENCPAGNQE